MKGSGIVGIFFLVVSVQTSWAQAPAPPIDRTPLARPRPVCSKSAQDPTSVLKDLVGLVTKDGFSVRQLSAAEGMLEAWKADPPKSEDSDRVLIWVERDLTRPTELIQVYFAFGRYMKIQADRLDVYRVVVTEAEEQRRAGPLRKLIVNYCVS